MEVSCMYVLCFVEVYLNFVCNVCPLKLSPDVISLSPSTIKEHCITQGAPDGRHAQTSSIQHC